MWTLLRAMAPCSPFCLTSQTLTACGEWTYSIMHLECRIVPVWVGSFEAYMMPLLLLLALAPVVALGTWAPVSWYDDKLTN